VTIDKVLRKPTEAGLIPGVVAPPMIAASFTRVLSDGNRWQEQPGRPSTASQNFLKAARSLVLIDACKHALLSFYQITIRDFAWGLCYLLHA
jgi:hypothetical protein